MPVDIVDAIPTFSVGGGDVQASGTASVAVPIATAIPTTCSPANNPVARLPLKLVARIEGLQFVEMTAFFLSHGAQSSRPLTGSHSNQ